MQEADPDRGRVARAARLDRGQGIRALEEPLEGFE